MVGSNPVADKHMRKYVKDTPTDAIESIRDAIAVINYLNFKGKLDVNQRMSTTVKEAYDE